jgi:SET family sugar efflux transporter-like MFS transporter
LALSSGIRSLASAGFPAISAAALVGLATALVNPFLPLFLIHDIRAGAVRLGIFLVLSALSSMIVATALGTASDVNVAHRRFIIGGGIAGCLGYGVFAVSRSYWFLLLISASLGAISSSVIPQIFSYARQEIDSTHPQAASLAISGLRMWVSIAWVVGPPIGALLLAAAGFPGLFALVCLAYGLIVLLAASGMKESFSAGFQNQAEVNRRRPSMQVAVVILAMTALQTAASLSTVTLPLLVTADLGAGVSSVGLVAGLCAALEIPLMVVLGIWATRTSPSYAIRAGAMLGIVYFVAAARVENVWQIAAVQVLQAAFIAAVMGVGISFFQDTMPHRMGYATTLYTNSSKISAMLAGGAIAAAQLIGYRAMFDLSAALSAAGLLLLPRPASRTGQG